jgi:beta-lactam-binding protein with PASTA domain
MLVFIIAVVVAVLIATSTSNTVVHFRQIVGKDVNDAVSSLKSFIHQYTK